MTAERQPDEEVPVAEAQVSAAAPLLDRFEGAALRPVEPAYVNVIRARTLLAWLPLLAGATVLDRAALDGSSWQGLLLVGVPLFAAMSVVLAPPRIWRRLAWALEPAMLRVVRGWWWHTDTLVPLVRVQHLDIARGPFDKIFGTATLVVHTAGTHNSTVSLPGLHPDLAAELAAIIRGHIQADLD